jgi:Domain of unknown function (DUF4145)
MPVSKMVRIQCGRCNGKTNHSILMSDVRRDDSDDDWWQEENRLVKCRGCDGVALLRSSTGSELIPEEIEEIFPSPIKGRTPIDDYFLLPNQIRKIYLETLQVADSDNSILAGIGIRAIVETVCKERSANGGDLKKKIDDLVSQGVLTREGADLLHKLRIMGNKAAHEVKPHSKEEISVALDVVNHLILGVYILPRRAKNTLG